MCREDNRQQQIRDQSCGAGGRLPVCPILLLPSTPGQSGGAKPCSHSDVPPALSLGHRLELSNVGREGGGGVPCCYAESTLWILGSWHFCRGATKLSTGPGSVLRRSVITRYSEATSLSTISWMRGREATDRGGRGLRSEMEDGGGGGSKIDYTQCPVLSLTVCQLFVGDQAD